MSNYYYLISSLFDPELDGQKKAVSLNSFMSAAEELLKDSEFNEIKKVFLFNDISNALFFDKSLDNYSAPSFYSKEEFISNLEDPDCFFGFLSRHFANKETGTRIHPDKDIADELITYFYEDIENVVCSDYLRDYFLFELELRNLTTALTSRKNEEEFKNQVIEFGELYERLTKNNSNDFGLTGSFQGIEKLLEAYQSNDLVNTEKIIENLRWDYLDESVGYDYFSFKFLIAYAVKMQSVERWRRLDNEAGKKVMDSLVQRIKSEITFS